MEQTDIREAVRHSKLPTLFIHGTADKVVPLAMAEELFSLHQGPKEQLFLPGLDHAEAFFAEPEQYTAKMDAFLRTYTDFF